MTRHEASIAVWQIIMMRRGCWRRLLELPTATVVTRLGRKGLRVHAQEISDQLHARDDAHAFLSNLLVEIRWHLPRQHKHAVPIYAADHLKLAVVCRFDAPLRGCGDRTARQFVRQA
jgi:hypothetical protein